MFLQNLFPPNMLYDLPHSLGGGSKVDCRACSFQSPNRYCKKVAFSICFVFTKQGTNCPSNRNHPVFSLVGFFFAIWNRKNIFLIFKLFQVGLVILMVQTIDLEPSNLFLTIPNCLDSTKNNMILHFDLWSNHFASFQTFCTGPKSFD